MPRDLVERTESPDLARYLKARAARYERDTAANWADDGPPATDPWETRRREVPAADLQWTQDFEAEPMLFEVGDRVNHPKFGQGEVAEVMRDRRGTITLAIQFDDAGRKILDPAFARLAKI